MAEVNKYEIILNDLNTIETQVSVLKNRSKSLNDRVTELEEQLSETHRENLELSQKVKKLEEEINKSNPQKVLFNSLDNEDREKLKDKLQVMISKIDLHLSAGRQV